MPKETNLEFKVGFFVLIAMVCLAGFIFSISDFSLVEDGKSLKVVFKYVNGLKINAPVRVAGVDQGIVKDIQLIFDRQDSLTKAEVLVWLNNQTKIPTDSEFTINQLGILGEQYLEITPGVSTSEFFENGNMVRGKDPIAQNAISERVLNVADLVQESIEGVNRIVTDENNVQSVRQSLDNISLLTNEVTLMSQEVRSIFTDLRSAEGTIGKMLYDKQLYDNLNGLALELRENPWKLLRKPKDRK
ncbi:MAG: MCE family protein [Candidatus Omnitrophica bacterium]|nr:MCE family protein [Candidatus Omnitrophota bacterium]